MKREHHWKIMIDGVPHYVDCRFTDGRYELYADGAYITQVYRKSVSTMWDGMEEPIVLFGEPCLFVIWDEKPDIVFNGLMIGRKRAYENLRKRRGQRVYIGYGILLMACILLLLAVVWLLFAGKAREVGLHSIFVALGAALTMGAWSIKHLWRLTQADNSSIIKQTPKEGD